MADIVEKVKDGLDRCKKGNGIYCIMCPYSNESKIPHTCNTELCRDAMSVIESLQSENKILSENCDGLSKQRDDFAQTIHEQKMEIERLKAEVEKAREEGFKDGQHNVFECMNASW